ncbi:MAG: thymidine phosphorylase [Clostridia bacterium]|nr:thymidine phosphorylase [Clostridia bacterium]
MLITSLIEKKRDGFEHTKAEIEFIINGLVDGTVADYQMTAWMMAVCCRGMTEREIADLTTAMVHSGETVDLSDLPGVKVDKHSTGGIGDTTTLVVAPLVAACGGTVAKMSGRGLAHTGGTLDKLESVPGVNIEQPLDSFKEIVRKTGVCVIGQSKNLDPADKKMYALRDVSGTVKSIPLISSSIMSKKIASGADAIVLDVKTGNGAFMETPDEARKLAKEMVAIGRNVGRRTVAIITDMNRPLGMAIGNGLEMREAIEVLQGKVPYDDPLVQVSFTLAKHLLRLSGIVEDPEDAIPMLKAAIESGEGLKRLRDMLEAMGGDPRFVDEPNMLVRVARIVPVYPNKSGFIGKIDAKLIGTSALMIGAGRAKVTDRIDPAVGILMKKRYGDAVSDNEPFAYMYVNDETNYEEAVKKLLEAVTVTDETPEELPLIYDIIE